MIRLIAEPMDAFLTAVRETQEVAETIFDGQARLGSQEHRDGLKRVVEQLTRPDHTPALNEELARYLRTSEALRASLNQPFSPDDDEAGAAEAFAHLWQSIDLSITRCPACKKLMDPNWGWCPYHADPTFFEGDDSLKSTEGAFKQWLRDDLKGPGNPNIADHLDSPLNKDKRLFVHWTEFEVFRRAMASSDYANDS